MVLYERHKGRNTDVMLSLDETGLSVFTADHRLQSHYAYGAMVNITHTRTTAGNYLVRGLITRFIRVVTRVLFDC